MYETTPLPCVRGDQADIQSRFSLSYFAKYPISTISYHKSSFYNGLIFGAVCRKNVVVFYLRLLW